MCEQRAMFYAESLLPFGLEFLSSSLLSKNVSIKTSIIRIVLLFLCGCETWSATLREEHTLRVFDNRVLRGISGPQENLLTEDWKILNNEELRLSKRSEITRLELVARMKEEING
jgi:hypothetical protein